VKIDKNQELAKLIGRRLREACESNATGEFPAAIASGLCKIRQAENQLVAAPGDPASPGARARCRRPEAQLAANDVACDASTIGAVDVNS
jgi:hypothetical protein